MPAIQMLLHHAYSSIGNIWKHILGLGTQFDTIDLKQDSTKNKVRSICQLSYALKNGGNNRRSIPNGGVISLWIDKLQNAFDPNDVI